MWCPGSTRALEQNVRGIAYFVPMTLFRDKDSNLSLMSDIYLWRTRWHIQRFPNPTLRICQSRIWELCHHSCSLDLHGCYRLVLFGSWNRDRVYRESMRTRIAAASSWNQGRPHRCSGGCVDPRQKKLESMSNVASYIGEITALPLYIFEEIDFRRSRFSTI